MDEIKVLTKRPKHLDEICANCDKRLGSHHGGHSTWPHNYCPDPEERMYWELGPGTVFKPTGKFKENTK